MQRPSPFFTECVTKCCRLFRKWRAHPTANQRVVHTQSMSRSDGHNRSSKSVCLGLTSGCLLASTRCTFSHPLLYSKFDKVIPKLLYRSSAIAHNSVILLEVSVDVVLLSTRVCITISCSPHPYTCMPMRHARFHFLLALPPPLSPPTHPPTTPVCLCVTTMIANVCCEDCQCHTPSCIKPRPCTSGGALGLCHLRPWGRPKSLIYLVSRACLPRGGGCISQSMCDRLDCRQISEKRDAHTTRKGRMIMF
jgi:hypothetical protein